MFIYRITKAQYAGDLSGLGAKLFGGRWNSKGTPILYFASSRSLAVLELFVHVSQSQAPKDLKILKAKLPDTSIEEFDQASFDKMLRSKFSVSQFKKAGDSWIDRQRSLALSVPSVIIPEEKNILVNPEHTDIDKLKIVEIEDFSFDHRLFL